MLEGPRREEGLGSWHRKADGGGAKAE